MIIANRLKNLRTSKSLSQEDLAEILNISSTAYGHYERGRTIPSTEMIIKLSKFYNVTTDYLLGRSDNPKLTQEEEKDVYKKFEELKDSLENTDDLMFCGEILDDETRELLLSSLKNTILTSKIIAKEREKNK